MSDIFSLLSNAIVQDEQGDTVGEVIGVHYIGGRLVISLNVAEGDGPDEGEREPKDSSPVSLSLVGASDGC